MCPLHPIHDQYGIADVAVKLSKKAGLYACWSHAGELIYVGKANSIKQRFTGGNHHKIREVIKEGPLGAISTHHFPPYLLEAMETILIEKANPRLNSRSNRSSMLGNDTLKITIEQLENVPMPKLEFTEELDFETKKCTKAQLKTILRKNELTPLLALENFDTLFKFIN